MCERCAELEAEVFVLRRELGLVHEVDQLRAVRAIAGLSKGQARMVLALYTAGRPLTQYALEQALRGPDAEPYDANTIAQFVLQIRRKLGADAIETIGGGAYRLSAPAASRVMAALHPLDAA